MKSFFASALLLTVTSTLSAGNITCKSIDPTFRPFYTVKLLDTSLTSFHPVLFERVLDLAGNKVEIFNKQGGGFIEEDSFFLGFRDGSGAIEGRRLPNGILKAELRLGGGRPEELTCE